MSHKAFIASRNVKWLQKKNRQQSAQENNKALRVAIMTLRVAMHPILSQIFEDLKTAEALRVTILTLRFAMCPWNLHRTIRRINLNAFPRIAGRKSPFAGRAVLAVFKC